MITLHTFGPFFGLPDGSPFVIKAEMLCKLAGLEYRTRASGLAGAPKGKLPFIDDDGVRVADSTLIRLHIERKYGVDFDRGLSDAQRGAAWCVEKMLEDHLYWVLVYWRWMIDANFDRGPRHFFRGVPAPVRPLVCKLVRRKVRASLHAHGLGRHDDAEKTALAARAVEALARVLGRNRYLFGDEPCGADATAFAFVASAMHELIESPVQRQMASMPNLVAYRDRMMAEYFPAFAVRDPAVGA